MAGGMEKRIADIVTKFSVEGDDEVKRALRNLRQSVKDAGGKSEHLSKNVEKTDEHTTSATKNVGKLDNALTEAGKAAGELGDATGDIAPNLDKSTDSADELRKALRRLRGMGNVDLFGGGTQADGDELLRYASEAKKAAKKLDDLKAQREALGPSAGPAFDGAIAEERRKLAYFQQRMADGTSEDAERAALQAQKDAALAAERVAKEARAAADKAEADHAEQVRKDADAAQRQKEAISRESLAAQKKAALAEQAQIEAASKESLAAQKKAALDEAAEAERARGVEDKARKARLDETLKNLKDHFAKRSDLARKMAKVQEIADKAAYAEAQKVRKAWKDFGDDLFKDFRFLEDTLGDSLDGVTTKADDASRAVRTIRIPPSMGGIEAVRALQRAHTDAAYAAKLHAQFVKETGKDYDALAAANRKAQVGQFNGAGVQALQQYAAAQRQIQASLQNTGRGPAMTGVVQAFGRVRQAAQRTLQSLRIFRQTLSNNIGAPGAVQRLNSAFITLRGTIRGIAGVAKTAFSEVKQTGFGVATALNDAFGNIAKTLAKLTFNDNMLEALPYIAAAAGAYTFSPAIGLLGGGAAAAAGMYTMQDVQPVRETAAALNMPAEQVDMYRYMSGSVGGDAEQGLEILKTTRDSMLEAQVEETKFQKETAKAVKEHQKALAEFNEEAQDAASTMADISKIDLTFAGPNGTRMTPAMLGLDAGKIREELQKAYASNQAEANGIPADAWKNLELSGESLAGMSEEQVGKTFADFISKYDKASKKGKKDKPPEYEAPEREIDSLGTVLKNLGIEVLDASGKMKSVTAFIVEVAKKWKSLSSEDRTFLMTKLYGSDASSEYGLMFDKLAGDPELLAKMDRFSQAQLFITDEDIAVLTKFTAMWNDLQLILKAFTRELFLAFEPFFSYYAEGITEFFTSFEARDGLIDKVFVKPFERAWRFVQDIMKAWFSFDFDNFLMGVPKEGVAPENEWLFILKKVALDVWMILQGVWNVIAGIGEALGGLFMQFDAAGQSMTGFSFIDWLKGPAAADVLAFTADLRKVLADLFTGEVVDPEAMTTWLGEAVRGRMEQVKDLISSVLTPTFAYLDEAWQQFWTGIQSGTGLESTTNTLSQLGLIAVGAAEMIGKFSQAVVAAFTGDAAPDGYGWVTELAGTLVELKDALTGLVGLLTPIYTAFDELSQALLGINGATTLILGGIGIAGIVKLATALATLRTAIIAGGVASGIVQAGAGVGLAGTLAAVAAPLLAISLAIGAVVGGIYVLYNLLTDFTGTVDAVVNAIKAAWEYLRPERKDINDPLTTDDLDKDIDDQANNLQWQRDKLQAMPADDVEGRARVEGFIRDLEVLLSEAIRRKAEAVQVQANLSPEAAAKLTAVAQRPEPLNPSRALQMQEGTAQVKADYKAQVADIEAQNAKLAAQAATMTTGTAEVKADAVNVNGRGSPVTIVMPNSGTSTGYFEPNQVEELIRSGQYAIAR